MNWMLYIPSPFFCLSCEDADIRRNASSSSNKNDTEKRSECKEEIVRDQEAKIFSMGLQHVI